MENLLEVKGLKTYFHTFKGVVKAVDNVDFHLKRGEILGLVGESGGGKSITGFSIIKLIEAPGRIEGGQIQFDNRDLMSMSEKDMSRIRGKEISFIFQDPMTSLNPVYTIGQQMEEVLKLHTKLTRIERQARCVELLESVGISNPESRLRSYPHQFSGGMRQRVVIAIALAVNPKLIIADEPTTALDVTIQAQILKLMVKLVKENNCSLILITHDLAVVSEVADRINVMYCGKIVETGLANDVIFKSGHPYTRGLIASIPDITKNQSMLETIDGIVPNMFELPKGCNFSPRCKFSQKLCEEEEPQMNEFEGNQNGHGVACHFPIQRVGD